MTATPHTSGDLSFTTLTTGVVIAPNASGDATLPAGTYYTEIGRVQSALSSIQWEWSAALDALITYERTNFSDADIKAAAGTAWVDSGIIALDTGGIAAGTSIADFADQAVTRMRAKIVVAVEGTLRGVAAFKVS